MLTLFTDTWCLQQSQATGLTLCSSRRNFPVPTGTYSKYCPDSVLKKGTVRTGVTSSWFNPANNSVSWIPFHSYLSFRLVGHEISLLQIIKKRRLLLFLRVLNKSVSPSIDTNFWTLLCSRLLLIWILLKVSSESFSFSFFTGVPGHLRHETMFHRAHKD